MLYLFINIFALGIYDSDKYAWGEDTGWFNFKADTGNVDIKDTELSGKVWSDNYGWVNLKPTNGGVLNTINGNEGKLSGNAWGENLGWVNFSNVKIDSAGYFHGTASTDNNGDINFDGDNISVRTYWRPNKTPTDITLSNDVVNDGDPSNSVVGILDVEDNNETNTYTYSLVFGYGDNSHFDINNDELILKDAPNHESKSNYNIKVNVNDTVNNFQKTFNIKVNYIGRDDRCLEHSIHGYAWSDGIGWISMDCKSAGSNVDYGVDVDRDGNLSGFAWSDDVGWIDFGYYGEDDRARFNSNTKKLEGKVKILSGVDNVNDGWTGTVSLAGITNSGNSYAPVYNPATKEFDEYAWGDGFVGWIDFKTEDNDGNILGVVTKDPFYFTFTKNRGTVDDPVPAGGSVVLYWATDGAKSCMASDGKDTTWTNNSNKATGDPNTASETIDNLQQDTKFSLTCEDNFHNILKKSVNVKVAPPAPQIDLYVDDDNIASNTSTGIHWNIENVKNCKATSSSGTWNKDLDSTNGTHDDSTGNLTESANWFKISCDSKDSSYYPGKAERMVWVNVEKLVVYFYPEENPIKFNDKVRLYWQTEFANSCESFGDFDDFNSWPKDLRPGIHHWDSQKIDQEGKIYHVEFECEGRDNAKIKKVLDIRVGNNPRYQEI